MIVAMIVTLQDILLKCPLKPWQEYRHTVRVDLVDGKMLLIRGRLEDFVGFKPTASMFTEFLEDKTQSVVDAILCLVESRIAQMATDQLTIAEYTNAIIHDLRVKSMTEPILIVITKWMRDILAGYEPAASLAGWHGWLNLCETYLLQEKL